MVTRPLMDSIASITRPSWRNGVGSTHWLRQAKRTIMSGMGGCSSCRLDWGIHSLHGARSPCLMWVDDAVGLSHLRFGEGIDCIKEIVMIGVLTHHWAKPDEVDEARKLLDRNGEAQSK